MLMIQQGPAAGPKLEKILASGFCEGVIWDPRDLRPKKSINIFKKTKNMIGCSI